MLITTPVEGKWFAAAKDVGLFDLAIELAARSPTDPRTLARAARDYCDERPDFAVAAGLSSLNWIALGHGHEITAADVLEAHTALRQAAKAAKLGEPAINERVLQMMRGPLPGNQLLRVVLANHLKTEASWCQSARAISTV